MSRNDIYLGKPPHNIEEFIKNQYCDIFIKKDGTKVQLPYDSSKTAININYPETELGIPLSSIDNFNFGKSYTEIVNLTNKSATHRIDLSRTNIESLTDLDLSQNQITSFLLPTSLISLNRLNLFKNELTNFSLPSYIINFYAISLYNNQLTSFSLPDSLESFFILQLESNYLTSFSLPDSLKSFNNLSLNTNCKLDMSHVEDSNKIPELNGEIQTSDSKSNTVIVVKNQAMKDAFLAKSGWNDPEYTYEIKEI